MATTATAQIVPPLPECLIVETGDRINSFSLGYGAGVANYMCVKPWRAILINLWAMRFWVNTNYGLKIRARIDWSFRQRLSIRNGELQYDIPKLKVQFRFNCVWVTLDSVAKGWFRFGLNSSCSWQLQHKHVQPPWWKPFYLNKDWLEDQQNFLTKETGKERSRKSRSGIICLSPCQCRTTRRVLESLPDRYLKPF